MDREIRYASFETFEHDWLPVLSGLQARTITTNYSTIVSDSEWEIAVTFTGRQDGRVAWMVTLVQVDGDVKFLNGLTPYATVHDEINRAIFQLTRAARWLVPLNAFVGATL